MNSPILIPIDTARTCENSLLSPTDSIRLGLARDEARECCQRWFRLVSDLDSVKRFIVLDEPAGSAFVMLASSLSNSLDRAVELAQSFVRTMQHVESLRGTLILPEAVTFLGFEFTSHREAISWLAEKAIKSLTIPIARLQVVMPGLTTTDQVGGSLSDDEMVEVRNCLRSIAAAANFLFCDVSILDESYWQRLAGSLKKELDEFFRKSANDVSELSSPGSDSDASHDGERSHDDDGEWNFSARRSGGEVPVVEIPGCGEETQARMRTIVELLFKRSAFDSHSLCPSSRIIETRLVPKFKDAFRFLRSGELVEAKNGKGGGYWLTESGKKAGAYFVREKNTSLASNSVDDNGDRRASS